MVVCYCTLLYFSLFLSFSLSLSLSLFAVFERKTVAFKDYYYVLNLQSNKLCPCTYCWLHLLDSMAVPFYEK